MKRPTRHPCDPGAPPPSARPREPYHAARVVAAGNNPLRPLTLVALTMLVAACGGKQSPLEQAEVVSQPQAARGSAAQLQTYESLPGVKAPVVSVTTQASDAAAPGYIFLTPRAPKPGVRMGPMILDSKGRIVWFHRLAPTRTSVDLQPDRIEGRQILTWSQRPPIRTPADLYAGDPRTLYDVVADSSYRISRRIRAVGHGVRTDLHDLVLTSKGTALVLGFRFVERDLRPYGGKQRQRVIDCLVQEVDLETGKLLFNWSAIEHVPLGDAYPKPSPKGDWDYFHVNSVDEDNDGNLIVSARHTSAVYKIDRTNGRVIWTLGGKHSSLRIPDALRFYYQHDARRQKDGTLTIFDNHAAEFDKRGTESRVLRLRVDEKARTVSLVRAYKHPGKKLLATSQGSARVLPNGNLFVGWGNAPSFSEFTEDGKLVFDASLPTQAFQSYRAFKGDWSGKPGDRPALSAARKGGKTIVDASWNGKTGIAQWRILGGKAAGSLKPLAVGPWDGLETALRFSSRPAYVAVEALDKSGKSLGKSDAIKPTG